MDPSEFIRLLKTDHYAPADLEEVNNVCRNYPMFSLAQMLKVRIKEALGQDKEADLKIAAVYATDRSLLYQMVSEVSRPSVPEPEEQLIPETEGIQFSEETNEQADVIIEQHAPYAAPEPAEDLLEIDMDESGESFTLDPEPLDPESLDPEPLDPSAEEQKPESDDLEESDLSAEPEDSLESDDLEESDLSAEPDVSAEPEASAGLKGALSPEDDLIRSFIIEEPGPIRADMKSSLTGDVSLSSIKEHDGFITDTLAKIYVKQRLYAKAIYAYEKLSLKYPEKSAYFAAQIEKIRNINHS